LHQPHYNCHPSFVVRFQAQQSDDEPFFQERLRQRFNPKTQKMEYEDPNNMAKRFYEDRQRNHSISALKYNYYEKPTSKKKRLAETKIYRRQEVQVKELIKYIQFMKDHEPK